jgi:hypothetical protein
MPSGHAHHEPGGEYEVQKIIMFMAVVATSIVAQVTHANAVLYNETSWEPGTWSLVTPFTVQPLEPGESYSVVTDRFVGAEPPGAFMLHQFTMNVPSGSFFVPYAPVMLDGWTHDPQTDGAIESISAAVRTFPASAPVTGGFGAMRFWLEQDGKYFTLSALSPNRPIKFPNFEGHDTDTAPEMIRTATEVTPIDFVEVIPEGGFNYDSLPDFDGSPISFGFGYSMTSTSLNGLGEVTRLAAFDDASVRLAVVPEPTSLLLLGLGGLSLIRRR